MAAQFKSSFIPKKTLSKTKQNTSPGTVGSVGGGHRSGSQEGGAQGGGNHKPPKKKKESNGANTSPAQVLYLNLFLVIGIVIFVGVGVTALGLFGYRYIIQNDIQEKSQALEAAEDEINEDFITRLQNLEVKFAKAQTVLSEHEALTPFFEFLEANTLRSVGFTAFEYSKESQRYTVVLEGQAEDYMSLALQSDVINQSSIINSTSFSNLSLRPNGNVFFTMTAQVNPSALSYDASLYEPDNGDVNETL